MLATIRARWPSLADTAFATVTAGSAGLLLVLLLVAARFLSAADYGRFSYAIALTTIVETLMDIGLGHVTVRGVARERTTATTLFGHVLGLKLVWVAGGLTVLFVVAPLLRPDPPLVRLIYILGVSSAIRSYLLTVRGLLQGLGRFDVEAVTVVADRLLLLVIGTAALASGFGLDGLGVAFVAARGLMLAGVLLLLPRIVGRMRPTFDRIAWKNIQAAALPLGLFMIALNLYTYIDTVILGLMRTDAETGWYAASYRIYEGLTYVPSIGAAVLTPRLSFLYVHDRPMMRRLLGRSLIGAIIAGIVLGGVTALIARPLVSLLFGAAYAPAAAPLQILAAGAMFVFCTWLLHAAAIGTDLDRRLLITTVVGCGANIGLNILLIPTWGIRGAAAATVAAEALTVAILIVQVFSRLRTAGS